MLELVELGPAVEQVEDPLDRGRDGAGASAAGRSIRRTKTAWSPTMKVGTPHTWWPLAAASWAACTARDRARRWRSRRTRRRRRRPAPPGPRAPASSSRSWPPWSWRSAKRASWTSRNRSGNLSRTTTPAWRASRPESSCQWPQMSGSPSATCTWPSENGTKVTSHGRPVAEPRDHVLVGVAGERAAVVPGDGEGARGRSCPPQRRGRPRHSAGLAYGLGQTRRATTPRPMPRAAPATTSDAWCIFTYTRLDGHDRPRRRSTPATAGRPG